VGSQTIVPPIRGLEDAGYLTSDTLLKLTDLPPSVAVIGGGYIAAEFGHFLAAMGSQVTIVGRNPRFLPDEEPEVSKVVKSELGKHMTILTDHEVREARRGPDGKKLLVALNRSAGKVVEVAADQILVAAGRDPLTASRHPEKSGVKTTKEGWIEVNEYLETSMPGIWAMGDADGKYLFKHVANYELEVLYYNAVLNRRVKTDYHAVPHAVFTHPEVAEVGMKESEVVTRFGKDDVLIGFYKYEDTAKGEAMAAKGYFVKAIVQRSTNRILGTHIVALKPQC
jgi:mycothione reductase